MNQLSNIVIDLARYRRARNAARRRTATDLVGRRGRGALLTCRWRRDAASGRLICCLGRAEGRARSAASFATLSGKLKDSQHERRPEAARRIRFQRFDGRPQQNATRNLKSPRLEHRRARSRSDGSPP